MRQLTNTLWDNSLINFESTHRHLIIFMRQFNSQTLWWSLILNLKMFLGNCLRKCCWIVPKSMFLSCFLITPSHNVMLTGHFGPAWGILTRVVSAWLLKGPFLHFSLIFSQNLTPAHLAIHTHIIMHTLSLSDFGQNNQRPKWLNLKIGRNDPPSKSETTHPLNLDKQPKVSKVAKIRNRYNQVPHLTQDTNGKVTNSQKTPQTRAKRSALSQQVTTKHI